MRWFTRLVFLSLLVATSAQASVDRKVYLQSLYKSLNPILLTYLTSMDKVERAKPENYFLSRILKLLELLPPELIFVEGQMESFVMDGQTEPRLMRAPHGPFSPIYVNQDLLNSDNFRLDLPQVLKILIHELGHKTRLGTVEERDHWAQEFESRLRPYAVKTVSADGSKKAEALSLPNEWMDISLTPNSFEVQPSFWVYLQNNDAISDISEQLRLGIGDQLISTRNLNVEIMMVTMGVTNMIVGMMEKLKVGVKAFSLMFSEPGVDEDEALEEMYPWARNMGHRVSALNLLHIHRLNFLGNDLVMDLSQQHSRSHKNFQINVTGYPLSEEANLLPVQAHVTNLDHPQGISVTTQLIPTPDFDRIARLGRISRNDGQLSQVEVSFESKSHPISVDLGLEILGDTFRVRAQKVDDVKPGTYKATFMLRDFERDAVFADRIIISNEEILFLDRQLEINPESTVKAEYLTSEEVVPDSIGMWGVRNMKHDFKKDFSHLIPTILSMVALETEMFLVNPYNLWIEFEVRDDVEIEQVELFWNAEMMLVNIEPGEKEVMVIHEKIDNVEIPQRYTPKGTLKERRQAFESVLFETEGMKVRESENIGFKKIKMKTLTYMKHVRPLANESEAHHFTMVTPIALKMVTKDHRIYHHAFPVDERVKGQGEGRPNFDFNCDDLLKTMHK